MNQPPNNEIFLTPTDNQRIADIFEIGMYLRPLVNNGKDNFLSVQANQWAIERAVHYVAEACSNISSAFKKSHPCDEWEIMQAMLVYLDNPYRRIDPHDVWASAELHVPCLIKNLTK